MADWNVLGQYGNCIVGDDEYYARDLNVALTVEGRVSMLVE